MKRLAAIVVTVLAWNTGAWAQVVIDTVTVDNPGNTPDTRYETPGYGGVAYAYNIGRFELTAGQYTVFLNAVAATDPYGLYNPNMQASSKGCQITRNGTDGTYTYDFSGRPSGTEADWVNRPVTHVSWGDAARFANWMHNGQPTGPQDLSTTEDGSYYLDGAMNDEELMAITRESDATWVIPSEDEWYKAAYHYNDGATGNYFDYPTSSDSVPSNDLIDPDPGNNATFYDSGYTIGPPYYRTEFGAHGNSDSPYGTFDQCGNVWEWNEGVIDSWWRCLRGGSFYNHGEFPHASYRSIAGPMTETVYHGFRVAEVHRGDCDDDGDVDLDDFTEFGTCLLGPGGGLGGGCGCFDFDDSGDVGLEDFGPFQEVFTGPLP